MFWRNFTVSACFLVLLTRISFPFDTITISKLLLPFHVLHSTVCFTAWKDQVASNLTEHFWALRADIPKPPKPTFMNSSMIIPIMVIFLLISEAWQHKITWKDLLALCYVSRTLCGWILTTVWDRHDRCSLLHRRARRSYCGRIVSPQIHMWKP